MKHIMKLKLFTESEKYIKQFELLINNYDADDIDLKYLDAVKDFKLNRDVDKYNKSLEDLRKKYPEHESNITKLAFNIWFNQAL